MEATKKDVKAVVNFIVQALKEKAVKEEKEANVELLTRLFQAQKMGDFRAMIRDYSAEDILRIADVMTVYQFYCQYFGCQAGTYKIMDFLVGAKKVGKKRRCLV